MLFNKLRRNRRGITALVIALVVALVAIVIIIPIGLLVVSKLETITKVSGMSATANSTVDTVNSNTYSAFSLAAVVPLLAGASLIIAIIIGAFAIRQRMQ